MKKTRKSHKIKVNTGILALIIFGAGNRGAVIFYK